MSLAKKILKLCNESTPTEDFFKESPDRVMRYVAQVIIQSVNKLTSGKWLVGTPNIKFPTVHSCSVVLTHHLNITQGKSQESFDIIITENSIEVTYSITVSLINSSPIVQTIDSSTRIRAKEDIEFYMYKLMYDVYSDFRCKEIRSEYLGSNEIKMKGKRK